MSKIRTCVVSKDHAYSYCPACPKDKDKPTWMFSFCSENCRDIYNVVNDLNWDKITESEAKEKLENLNTEINITDDDIKSVVDRLTKNVSKKSSANEEITDDYETLLGKIKSKK